MKDNANTRTLLSLASLVVLVLSAMGQVVMADEPRDGPVSVGSVEQGGAFGPKGTSGRAVYIIQLADAPMASYRGGIASLAATNPAARGEVKLDPGSSAGEAYVAYLDRQQAGLLATASDTLNRRLDVRFSYKHAFNGLAVDLSPEEAQIVAGLKGVLHVQRDYVRFPQTDAGPQWIGADGIWDGSATGGLPGTRGEGVTIGVIDTGINMDHVSFAEVGPVDGYVHINPLGSGNFLGLCDSNPDAWDCNDKLIGYYIFTSETTEDTDGHGSHTASTAAGNVVTATVEIAATNPFSHSVLISGVAPHASIVAYDACLDAGGCAGSALTAAIDQATADGVDVINYSIGGSSSDPWSDSDSLAFLGAVDAGIISVTSAGNSGPGAGTIGSPADAPWMLAVGASTHNRAALNGVINMCGGDTSPPADAIGAGVGVSYGPAPIVHASSEGDAECLNPFPANTWTNGEIVVCDRGEVARVRKGLNVQAGGAGGYVLANTDGQGESVEAEAHIIPGVHIGEASGDALRAWLASGTGHTATIQGTIFDETPSNGDVMADFSSRGPNTDATTDIIKPDVAAPGSSILAAYRSGSGPDGDDQPWMSEFNYVSGTSMSSPHTAGGAALLRALHPTWSPAEIKSALMLTAVASTGRKEDGATPVDAFDVGAGRLDLSRAGVSGLVMDETKANFMNADPQLSGDPQTLNLASMSDSDCYRECTWSRTVSNSTQTTMTWEGTYVGAGTGALDPISFTLSSGAGISFALELDVAGLTQERWHFGDVEWTEITGAAPDVRMPVAAWVARSTDPAALILEVDKAIASKDDVLTYTITLTNTDTITRTFTMTDDIPAGSTYVPGSATGGLSYDLGNNRITWSGELGPAGTDINLVESASPYGYVSLAAEGWATFTLPSGDYGPDDGGWIIPWVDFYYCGEHYTSTIWSVNGTVEAGRNSELASSPTNTHLPTVGAPNNLLAPWWTDLNLTDNGNWYHDAWFTRGSHTWHIFEWENAPRYDTPTSLATFQVWIEKGTDNIWFVYGGSGVDGSDGTVGAENADGTVGDTTYFNGSGTYPSPGVDLKVECVTGAAAPQTFTFQVQTTMTGTMVINEVEVSDGSVTQAAWANTEIPAYVTGLYLPMVTKS